MVKKLNFTFLNRIKIFKKTLRDTTQVIRTGKRVIISHASINSSQKCHKTQKK